MNQHSNHLICHQRILGTLEECEATCEHMTTHLKTRHHMNLRARKINLLLECADICTLTSRYISRNSMFTKGTAGLCAENCEICGKECARFPGAEFQHCARM